jgi:hypothetical protein
MSSSFIRYMASRHAVILKSYIITLFSLAAVLELELSISNCRNPQHCCTRRAMTPTRVLLTLSTAKDS